MLVLTNREKTELIFSTLFLFLLLFFIYGLVPSMFIHFFLFFIPIILLDVNKIVYVFTVLGPILSWAIAKNKDEIGSIWCFITIPIFIISLLYSKYN